MPSSACDWSSDVCSSDRSEEHTSELQSRSDLVCRILRSEEHTSELQSRSDLVCRLLLEKKNVQDPAHDTSRGPGPSPGEEEIHIRPTTGPHRPYQIHTAA